MATVRCYCLAGAELSGILSLNGAPTASSVLPVVVRPKPHNWHPSGQADRKVPTLLGVGVIRNIAQDAL